MTDQKFGINRIRLEFKGELEGIKWHLKEVLIESDWNLKSTAAACTDFILCVLIESDWNLKLAIDGHCGDNLVCINRIRLEFKELCHRNAPACNIRINRIRLEFKGKYIQRIADEHRRINRIRLEFKVDCSSSSILCICFVLIESDWNLKFRGLRICRHPFFSY